jgi:hypothetical protein
MSQHIIASRSQASGFGRRSLAGLDAVEDAKCMTIATAEGLGAMTVMVYAEDDVIVVLIAVDAEKKSPFSAGDAEPPAALIDHLEGNDGFGSRDVRCRFILD